jgi:RNA polymerase sigma factor (sigma-70 family)
MSSGLNPSISAATSDGTLAGSVRFSPSLMKDLRFILLLERTQKDDEANIFFSGGPLFRCAAWLPTIIFASTMPFSEKELSAMVVRCKYAPREERVRLLNHLFTEVKPYLFLMLEGCCRDHLLIEDLVQEVLVRVSKRIHWVKARNFRQFRAYCLVAAKNALRSYYRRAGTRAEVVTDVEFIDKYLQDRSEFAKSGFEALQDREDKDAADRVLQSLDPVCRAYLELFYIRLNDYRQIAERFGTTRDAVRAKIKRCRSEAQERFNAEER